MIKFIWLPAALLFVACAGTGTGQGPGKLSFSDEPSGDYAIPNVFLTRTELNPSNAINLLWTMTEIIEKRFQMDNQFSQLLRTANITRIGDLAGRRNDCGARIYQLENCQAMAAAVLIANDIPLMLEIFPKDGNETFYALFYRYKIVPNNQRVGEAALSGDGKIIYLEYNLDFSGRVLRQMSKTKLDFNNHPLTPDLFDAQGKRDYDAFFKNTMDRHAFSDKSYALLKFALDEITLDNLYLITPSSYDEGKLKALFEAGMESLDFSYKVPVIKRLY